MRLEHRIKAARGELKADLLIRNCRLVNVCSGEIHPADVAVSDGVFLGFGDYRAEQVIEAGGRSLCPGLIDGHLHIESSLLSPVEFAKAAAAHGTAAVICDPHEICNVLGVKGLEYMLAVTEALPLAVYCQVPSCVPATHLETAGGRIDAQAIAELFARYPHRLTGLAEMMNFPGVLFKDPGVLAKLRVAGNLIIDGHCPQLGGRDLNASIRAGGHPIRAIQMVSINTARYFGLKKIGAVAPGYRADFLLVNDLQRFDIEAVYLRGQEIGEQAFEAPPAPEVHGSVKFGSLAPAYFQIPAPPGPPKARCLELIPGQILTGTRALKKKFTHFAPGAKWVKNGCRNAWSRLLGMQKQEKRPEGFHLRKMIGNRMPCIRFPIRRGCEAAVPPDEGSGNTGGPGKVPGTCAQNDSPG